MSPTDPSRPTDDDRFDRLRRIPWWDQAKLAQARVLVVGAGALGNEIIKNLSLLGVGRLFIADLDRVENSNLSRSILFREKDNGQSKAESAAKAARDIYPGIHARAFTGNVVYDLGLGVFRWADVVIGGLDNREARLHINRACWKTGRPWIDGAIEVIDGVARVFVPDGPCYECTMTHADWQALRARRSCNLLSRAQMQQGRTPTTPTISSIIAGVQCQEAIKLLHGQPVMAGRGWVFSGMTAEAYTVEYQRNDECYSHDRLESIVSLDGGGRTLTLGAIRDVARQHLGPEAHLEFGRDILWKLICPSCHEEQQMLVSLGKVGEQHAMCPRCPDVRRGVVTFHSLSDHDDLLARTPADIGLPPFDIIVARAGGKAIGLELSGDAAEVLGEAHDAEGLEWA